MSIVKGKKVAVVLSCNDNNAYKQWIDYTCRAWLKMGIEPILVGIDVNIDSEHVNRFIRMDNVYGVKTSSIAQVCRLYIPATLKEYDSVLIADIDQIPIPNKYFTENIRSSINEDAFVAMRKVNNTYFMGWNVAPPHIWSDLFNVNTLEDVESTLLSDYDRFKSAPWSMDQTILQEYLNRYNNLKVVENLDLYAINISERGTFRKGLFACNKPKPQVPIHIDDLDLTDYIAAGTATAAHFNPVILEKLLNLF